MAISGGDEFLRRLEQIRAEQEIKVKKTTAFNMEDEEQSSEVNELDDIKIEKNISNKQKYIIFGISLVLLFIITIVILKAISSNDSKTQDNLISQEQVLEKEFKTVENTQNIIKEPPKNIEKKLDINKIEQKEIPLEQKKEVKKIVEKKDPLEISEEKEFVPEIPIKNIEKKLNKPKTKNKKLTKIKKIALKPKISNLKTKIKPKGFFIQVGAFTKKPSKILLTKLKKYKLGYTLYRTKVKGRYFTKVLVGPYKNRLSALDDLNMVRQITKNSGAFIIKF